MKSAELKDFELYDLNADIAETKDLKEQRKEVFPRLQKSMQQLYLEVRTAGPIWHVWKFARYEGQRIEWPDYWLNRKKK